MFHFYCLVALHILEKINCKECRTCQTWTAEVRLLFAVEETVDVDNREQDDKSASKAMQKNSLDLSAKKFKRVAAIM